MKKDIGRVKKGELFVFDGKEKEYDIPPEMVKLIRDNLKSSGKEIMNDIMDASNKCAERTFHLVKEVAKKTGIKFPHLLQAYLEFFLNIALGVEYYSVKESTRRSIRIEIPECPKKEKWCDVCKDAIMFASDKLNMSTKVRFSKKDSICIVQIENL